MNDFPKRFLSEFVGFFVSTVLILTFVLVTIASIVTPLILLAKGSILWGAFSLVAIITGWSAFFAFGEVFKRK